MSYLDVVFIANPSVITLDNTLRQLLPFVRAGKLRHIGLSEPDVATLRRAEAIHPIVAVRLQDTPFCGPQAGRSGYSRRTWHPARSFATSIPASTGSPTGMDRVTEDQTKEKTNAGSGWGLTTWRGSMTRVRRRLRWRGSLDNRTIYYPWSGAQQPQINIVRQY